jgi:hypothetical protein
LSIAFRVSAPQRFSSATVRISIEFIPGAPVLGDTAGVQRVPLAIAAALAIVAAVAAGESTAIANRPTLRLVDASPLRVRGDHFRPREVVRVTAATGWAKHSQQVRSGRTGSFVATFRAHARTGACSPGLTVHAVGNRGTRAMLRLPAVACPPDPFR